MGRMSPLHSPTELTAGVSIPPASRNGAGGANTVNGAAIDLRGLRGAFFSLQTGAVTGAANVAAYLQTGDNLADSANANWTNVNATLYTNAAVTAKTNANSAFEMSYDPAIAGNAQVRAVLVTDANVFLAGITHVTY